MRFVLHRFHSSGRIAILAAICGFVSAEVSLAGGGVVLRDDVCIITIGFYEAHFTAYQPETRGNEEFCEDLPDAGVTIFVLDYLHDSLKEVPVDFRIIRDVTGRGQYVRIEDIEALDDIERETIHYQPPRVQPDASLKVNSVFAEKGRYVGIVSAGHPSNDTIYYAVFPFEVGAAAIDYRVLLPLLAAVAALGYLLRRRYAVPRRDATSVVDELR